MFFFDGGSRGHFQKWLGQGARVTAAIAAAVALSFSFFAPAGASAAEKAVPFHGQESAIFVEGDPMIHWIGSPTEMDSELVLVWTNSAAGAVNKLRTTLQVEARVTVVGGGGSGGFGSTGSNPGGGGGGGGEVKEKETLSYDANTYTITVGAGGATKTASGAGNKGQLSKFALGENVLLSALGGGGGGCGGDAPSGTDIAGGGGGSKKGAGGQGAVSKGGAATSSNNNYAGGGGGAGGDGLPAEKALGGKGGPGLVTTITDGWFWFDVAEADKSKYLDAAGNIRCGGGGGGGQSANYTVDNAGTGTDGGGRGGVRDLHAKPAIAYTGGGGGGGGRGSDGCNGGAGGDGVVIVRISFIYVPMVWKEIPVSVGGNSGYIFVDENAAVTKMGDDILIAYSNVNQRGGLNFAPPNDEMKAKYPNNPPIWANARVLAVGGGGGGGFINERLGGGGGAGGGAGGFVETSGLVFDNSVEFSIAVGRGGKGGAANEECGEDGAESSVTTNGLPVVDVALGGGGGGAHSDGRGTNIAGLLVASGGGGSRSPTADASGRYERDGGKGAQGFDGGDATDGMYVGAGGGGAGGKGGDAAKNESKANVPGDGGLGKASDITGPTLYYAGGGAGAAVNFADLHNPLSLAKGGSGVGGNGAGVEGGNAVSATDGKDGTGSGGGGGVSHENADETAGKGGDGVVIIRLSGFVVKNIPVPGKLDPATGKYWGPTTNVYDGTEHVGVADFFAYTFKTNKDDRTTWPVGVEADNYVVTVNIKSGAPYFWADWKEGDPEERKWGDRTISWRINRRVVEVPEVTEEFTYDATEHIAVDADKLHLDLDGYCYTDDELRLKFCQLTPTHRETNVKPGPRPGGWYTFDAQLFKTTDANGQPATNFVWSTGKIADVPYHWRIAQAKNEILKFDYPPRNTKRQLNPLSEAVLVCDWPKRDKMKLGENILVEYRPWGTEGEGGWTAWGGAAVGKGPQEAGSYEIRVTVPECDNWAGATVSQEFGTWKQLADIFSDQMTVTVAGNTATSDLADFPVPVKVHQPNTPGKGDGYEPFSGFEYARAGADGTELRFFDKDGDPVEHDVDTWNIHGESVLWVRVPKLTGTTTKLTMCWRRVSDIYLRPYDPAAVWKQYTGVWHMSGLVDGRVTDATGNGHDAYLTGDAKSEFIDGKMGKAIKLKSGDLLADGWPYKVGTLTNRFTYSGWYRYPDFAADGKITGGYKMFAGTKLGATSTTDMNNFPGWCLRMNNNAGQMNWNTSPPNPQSWNWNWGTSAWNVQTTWGWVGYRANYQTPRAPTTDAKGVTTYYGSGLGRYYASAGTFNKSETDGINYHVDGSDKPLQLTTGGFEADEVRLSTNALSQTWMEQEERSLYNKDYCTYSLVQIDCDKYNNGAGLKCDYWTTLPTIAKSTWHVGETSTLTKGNYAPTAIGGANTDVSVTYRMLPDGTPTTTTSTTLPSNLLAGYYEAVFDHTSPASYRPQAYPLHFYILAKHSTNDVTGVGGDSGRILLMNADTRTGASVTNQGWCARSDTGVTYWRQLDQTPGTNNVLPGTRFELVRSSDTNVLWRLYDCRQGNTFPTNDAQSLTAVPWNSYCYLPQSPTTALSVTNENVKATKKGDTGWAMLRNVHGAAIYSPCYTNGIGTIYFDAVNSAKGSTTNCAIVLEIATLTDEGLPPTDENCWRETAPGVTNWYAKLEDMWEPVTMEVARFTSSSTTTAPSDLGPTARLLLQETSGGYQYRFYRVHAQLNERGPARFRIRRDSIDAALAEKPDECLILVDNVIASIPPVCAELEPYGAFDPDLMGAQALGQVGAFEPALLSAGKPAPFGRCRVKLPANSGYEGKSPDDYLSLSQMFYRWRYLNQLEPSTNSASTFGEWKIAKLAGAGEGGLVTAAPLDVQMKPGDIEFYFTAAMSAPYYAYVDYTTAGGTRKVSQKDFTEEQPLIERHLDTKHLPPLASMGEDWFVRIRDGQSEWEQMKVELRGAIEGVYPMELTADGMWRAVVQIPEEAAGECSMRFNGVNRHEAGRDFSPNETTWSGGDVEVELPANGFLTADASATKFKVDHASDHLVFKARDTGTMIWSVMRAEYQNFNLWNDAYSPADNPLFHVNYETSNGVDSVRMAKKPVDWGDWRLFQPADANWNELFDNIASFPDPGFPLDRVFVSHRTPNDYWGGEYISFVADRLVAQADAQKSEKMAGKLLGSGQGRLNFIQTEGNTPDGLDTITFKARLGQSVTYDAIAYDKLGALDEDYMFFAPVTMSQDCKADGTSLGDMAVGASISLVCCYDPYDGCYEFRVERPYSGKEYTMSLRKWTPSGAEMVCATLCTQRFSTDSIAWTDESSPGALKTYYGMFVSCRNTEDGLKLVAGLSKSSQALNETYPAKPFSGGNFNGLVYTDKTDPLFGGSAGVMAKDCPAQFLEPIQFHEPLDEGAIPALTDGKYFADKSVSLAGASSTTSFDYCSDTIDQKRRWALPDRRIERYAVGTAVGLRTPIDLEQTAVVQIRALGKTGETDWETVLEQPVKTYSFEKNQIELNIRRTGQWNLRLTTGASAVDVVFDDVTQTRWHAPDIEGLDDRSDGFVYTQGLMETNVVARRRELVLQPARATAAKPVSLRSPILGGLGKISFSYEGADPAAEIWVQVATNNVTPGTLMGAGGYNQSVEEGSGVGQWTTVRKYGPLAAGCDEELGSNGVKAVYIGWHDNAQKKNTGVFRLFVPVKVVEKAIEEMGKTAMKSTGYGKVTLTGALATDEPALSDRAWRGWNMRTAGDERDEERRMYLFDATIDGGTGFGLVCGLNNTADGRTLTEPEDEVKARASLPTIYSPTFGTVQGLKTGVGAVEFKARLYARPGDEDLALPGRVVVYGAADSVSGGWRVLATNEVVSTVFSNFTWSAAGESYSAIKFELSSPGYGEGRIDAGRILLDEIVISEKVQPAISFEYARPFRMNLISHEPIADILSPDEQPLVGESWGIQTKLALKQLENEVDVNSIRVFFSYYSGKLPWGYDQWKNSGGAVTDVELECVGDRSNLVFRSNFEVPRTLVEPATKGGVVQYMLIVRYGGFDGGEEGEPKRLDPSWKQPEWYYPVDYNRDNGGYDDQTKFAGYTILDTVSPGRAWINEVNWNDGQKDEAGSNPSTTNQFVEVCVPSGVDMGGWYVQLTSMGTDSSTKLKKTARLFCFGAGDIPKSKATGKAVNGYEFFVVQSPKTREAGGIAGIDGKPAADATWTGAISGNAPQGTLSYYQPFQFELYRPSGVLEHQFVLQGTNIYADVTGSEYMYTGTNLVRELNEQDYLTKGRVSPRRFYAGEETARRWNGALYGSAGVVGTGTDKGEAASERPLQYGPGSDGTWKSGLLFTAGSLNEGQVIPQGWFLPPNGTNSWIYASVVGDHIRQTIGGLSDRTILFVVPQGGKTNIHYDVDNFWELDSITVNGVTNASPRHVPHSAAGFDWELTSPSGTMYVVATDGVDNRLLEQYKLGGSPYAPSVLRWLTANWPDRDVGDIVLARAGGFSTPFAGLPEMELTDMYWLDIPPFTESNEPEWVLRHGISSGPTVLPSVEVGATTFTNLAISVKMFVENVKTHVTNGVARLQGLDDSRSDDPLTYQVWNSETIKIRGALSTSGPYMPFRTFIVNGGSFGAPGTAHEYESYIEILDPFSIASPGAGYGWAEHPEKRASTFWEMTIDKDTQPVTTEMLKPEMRY